MVVALSKTQRREGWDFWICRLAADVTAKHPKDVTIYENVRLTRTNKAKKTLNEIPKTNICLGNIFKDEIKEELACSYLCNCKN